MGQNIRPIDTAESTRANVNHRKAVRPGYLPLRNDCPNLRFDLTKTINVKRTMCFAGVDAIPVLYGTQHRSDASGQIAGRKHIVPEDCATDVRRQTTSVDLADPERPKIDHGCGLVARNTLSACRCKKAAMQEPVVSHDRRIVDCRGPDVSPWNQWCD